VLREARQLFEHDGPEGLTMRALARSLHVSAPSLYLYVESRSDLLSQLVILGINELATAIRDAAALPGDVHRRALTIAHAYIEFGTTHPHLFTLMFGPAVDEARVDFAAGEDAAAPLLALVSEIVAPADVISLASALWAFVHGYTVLRLAAQFRMNPEHEPAFERALIAMLEGAKLAAFAPAR
jgi:AcrR family transcriptional regulator